MAGKKSSGLTLIGVLLVGAVLWWVDNGEEIGRTQSDFEVLEGCVLVAHGGNDGDSFHVRETGGREQEFRLYFVDAPESALKHYRNGDSNEERLRYQAKYFGRLSQERTTELGQEAKKWTAGLLGRGEFTVYTKRELVYEGPRQYAFVEVEYEGERRWLHELLIEEGLARIYTKGAWLPDGTSVGRQEVRLEGMERKAKRGKKGGWR